MFGNHTLPRATAIAEQKTRETGKLHRAIPAFKDNGDRAKSRLGVPMYTIGRALEATTADELLARFARKGELP